MTDQTWRFNRAIVRKPGLSVVNGLRAVDSGPPDLEQICSDHASYTRALQEAGARLIELPALDEFPDALFVEDTALCLPQLAILMRPGASSRAGEVEHMAPTLREHYDTVLAIQGPGTIEGGDILITPGEILVGLSERTDKRGVGELTTLVADYGYRVRTIGIPDGVLHFKTDCSLLDGETILSTPRLAASGCFDGYRVIHTCEGEAAAANCIRYNDHVLMSTGFPLTASHLREAGYEVREINNRECAKIDGGMSCLSLRLHSAAAGDVPDAISRRDSDELPLLNSPTSHWRS